MLGKRIEFSANKFGGRKALATAIGVSERTLNAYIAGESSPQIDKLQRIADRAGVNLSWLVTGEGTEISTSSAAADNYKPIDKRIPIYGTAAGSVIGSIAIKQEPIGWTDRPRGLQSVTGAYALYVTGSSMEPRYFPGELIFINPHRPPRQGDIVIIQEQLAPDGETLSYVKEFSRRNEKSIVTKQYNPPSNVEFMIQTVKDIHRVLTTNELLNV